MMANFLYRQPRLLLLTMVVIIAAGLTSFFVLPRLEDPALGRRVGIVSTAYPGASAKLIESLVTEPLEEALRGISDIKELRSNSQSGISNIVITLQDEVDDVEPAWTLVRNRLSDIQPKLPETSFVPELHVVPLKAFAAIVAVKAKADADVNLSQLRPIVRELQSELSAIKGTESVTIFGDAGEEFSVDVSATRLAALGLSTAAIAEQLKAAISSSPAGQIPAAESHTAASLPLEFDNATDAQSRIENALITFGSRGESTSLSDIASVARQLKHPVDTAAWIDGRAAIVVAATVSDEIRIDHWADNFESQLETFRQPLEETVEVDVLFSQRNHVDQRLRQLLNNLTLGTLAVMAIVLLMMGWRSMLVVAAALPLSALMVLAAMRFLKMPLHQMSITGLIVALGLLIDNAIVIVEDVRCRIIKGDAPSEAIRGGVRHLAMPLCGSTLTTVLAFLPIATLPGPPGEFVGSIAISVIIAICASLMLSMTVIPALISLLKIDPTARGPLSFGLTISPLRKLFELSLRLVFRVPPIGIALGMVLPLLGFLAAGQLPEQFFPPSDRAQLQIEVEQPARDSLLATNETVQTIRTLVAKESQIDRQYWFSGGSAPTFFYNVVPRRRSTPFYAQAFIDLKSTNNVGALVRRLQNFIDQEVPQGRVIVRQLEQGPPFDAPIELRIVGPELATLQELGSQLRAILSKTPQIIHTRSDLEESIPRLTLSINEEAVQAAGLNRLQLSGLLYTTLNGASAGTVFDANEELPVRVKLALDGKLKLNRLAALPLPAMKRTRGGASASGSPAPAGEIVPLPTNTLASLTEMKLEADVGAIVRVNGRRANEVKAYIQAGILPSTVIDDFKSRLAATDFVLPSGYALEFGGETEQRTQAIDRLIANGVVLFSLMLLTLVASFQSFRCAAIVASVGGLSVGLGPLALAAFGFPFGFMAIVGTMGLVGVAINDSIVVLAALRANDAASIGDRTATVGVVIDCSRHVIATTLTTIVGFLPLIIAGGGFWPPLAISIAGGVGGATLLALYFVPCCHLLVCSKAAKRPSEEQGVI